MSRKAFFLCFTGIDGSGKTTLSKKLVNELNNDGIQCKYVYARLAPFFSKPFILLGELIFLRKTNKFLNYKNYSSTKQHLIKKHSILSELYWSLLLADYLIQIYYKIGLPLALNKNIICDRYIYDTVITDISVDKALSDELASNLIDRLLNYAPRPDQTFLIDISEEIAYKRKNDIPSIDYLIERRKIYLGVGKLQDMYILNGSEKFSDILNLVRKILKCDKHIG